MSSSYFILSREKEPRLFELIEDFAKALNIGAFVMDINGKRQSEQFNCSAIWQQLARWQPDCCHWHVEEKIEGLKKGEITEFISPAGFSLLPFPIYINNILVGFVMLGQVAKQEQRTVISKCLGQAGIAAEKQLTVDYFSQERLAHVSKLFLKMASAAFHNKAAHKKIDIRAAAEMHELKENTTDKAEILKAMGYIKKHLSRPLSLEEVANHVYLSQYYFSKLFKKELGMNFITYLNWQRVKRAEFLLLHTDLNIDEISKKVGFSQASYFCKIFKNLVSQSPAAYRKKTAAAYAG